MSFGSFLKKAINPLTPFKAIAGAGKNLAKGNVKGALRNMTLDAATMGLGPSGGAPKMMPPGMAAAFGMSRMPGGDVQGGIPADPGAMRGMAQMRGPGQGQMPPGMPGGIGGVASAMAQRFGGPNMAPQPGMQPPGGAPPPPPGAAQMGMAEGGPPPQPFLDQVQQTLTPPEFSDPYEAQKQRRIRGY